MDSPDVESSPAAGSSSDLAGLHILVVEDSWQVGEAIAELLRLWGADVAGPAAAVVEAEALVRARVPDLAIVDFTLRKRERADGLIKRLKDQGVRVMVISGHEDLPPRVMQAAMILKKPFTDIQLRASLLALAHKAAC